MQAVMAMLSIIEGTASEGKLKGYLERRDSKTLPSQAPEIFQIIIWDSEQLRSPRTKHPLASFMYYSMVSGLPLSAWEPIKYIETRHFGRGKRIPRYAEPWAHMLTTIKTPIEAQPIGLLEPAYGFLCRRRGWFNPRLSLPTDTIGDFMEAWKKPPALISIRHHHLSLFPLVSALKNIWRRKFGYLNRVYLANADFLIYKL